MAGFNGQLPLHRACLRGDIEIVRLLLRHGADPNGKNDFEETALHFASKRGNPVLLRELIDHGADVRAEDRAGKGALHHAAHTGSV
jgi:palmitoyltransferase ZDHHC13/17